MSTAIVPTLTVLVEAGQLGYSRGAHPAGTLGAGEQTFTIADASEFAFNPGVGSASLTGAGCGTLAIGSGPTGHGR